MTEKTYIIKVKTLVPLWTGDINRKCNKIKETGIIGSFRWWYEALVRGLGSYACDTTSNRQCKFDKKEIGKNVNIEEALDKQICPSCQLFGCTGWKRKIQFKIKEVLGNFRDGFEGEFNILVKELKSLKEEEKWLLKKTFEIISNYGSIGGKTTRKPHDNPKRPIAGKDYGLVSILNNIEAKVERKNIETWLKNVAQNLEKENHPEWPNLKYFFFVKGKFLDRIQINEIMNIIPYLKGKVRTSNDLGRSKRIFSFKFGGGRVWGYVKDENMLNEVIKCLKDKFGITNILRFEDVVK